MITNEESILQQLSRAGYRITEARRAVIRALYEDVGHASPAEVHAKARGYCATVGLVTVYRTLELLAAMGLARRIHSCNGCQGYTLASHGHHHHLVCHNCGATLEFQGCDLAPLLQRVTAETGFRIDSHLLELSGLCAACQQEPRLRRENMPATQL